MNVNGSPFPEIGKLPSQELTPEIGTAKGESSASAEGPSFVERLKEAVGEVDATQRQADAAAQDFAAGRQDDIHGTMLALQRADIGFRFVANVRNRVIEAYREVMRMGA